MWPLYRIKKSYRNPCVFSKGFLHAGGWLPQGLVFSDHCGRERSVGVGSGEGCRGGGADPLRGGGKQESSGVMVVVVEPPVTSLAVRASHGLWRHQRSASCHHTKPSLTGWSKLPP